MNAYREHHFKAQDVGVAWTDNRVWVCLDGGALFRAKIINGKLFTEFYPPSSEGTPCESPTQTK